MSQNWDEQYKARWDERYKNPDFAYGEEPNVFFKEWIQKSEPGAILMPADGEGRNGVYAAQQGWQVTSCDLSEEGRDKAMQLATKHHVPLKYRVGDLKELQFEREGFDAIGLVYAHFSAKKKPVLHKKLNDCLRPGGTIIFEAFSQKHLDYVQRDPKVGGPRELDMLYSKTEILNDFKNYEIILLEEEEILLKEGKYHNGKGSVIRFVGRKAS